MPRTPSEGTAHSAESSRAVFPGWSWAALVLAVPIAGYIGWGVSGAVDEVTAALIGGAITGALLGGAEWLAAREAFGEPVQWVAASSVGYGLGLALGAAAVGYGTGLGHLVAMGAISGVVLGSAQGIVLASQGSSRFALAWGSATPILLALGWTTTTLLGIDVDRQFTIFGAFGAVVFTVLSGLLLARISEPAPAN